MKLEPPCDKTNKITVRPAKTQIILGIRPVWSQSLLCAQWVAKDPSFLHADSEDWSDWAGVFTVRTCHVAGFVMRREAQSCFQWKGKEEEQYHHDPKSSDKQVSVNRVDPGRTAQTCLFENLRSFCCIFPFIVFYCVFDPSSLAKYYEIMFLLRISFNMYIVLISENKFLDF